MTETGYDGDSIDGARQWLRGRVDKGERCPCCRQMAKIYKRSINSSMAVALIRLHRFTIKNPSTPWYHMADISDDRQLGDFSKLRYWDLVEEKPKDREKTKTRTSGYWRITAKGSAFASGEISVPKYAKIYDTRCLGFIEEKLVDIRQALSKKFDYAELMSR